MRPHPLTCYFKLFRPGLTLISHGQLFEPPAVNNGIAFVTQRLEVDVIGFVDQMIHIPSWDFIRENPFLFGQGP